MSYCKANSCYNSISYSWNDYCSYHERCLSKLRERYDVGDIREIETFETWFNKNCGYVINYNYNIWIVVYEPAVRSMGENIAAIKYKNSYGGLSGASSKAQELKKKLQNDGFYDTPMLEVHPYADDYRSFSSIITSPYIVEGRVPHDQRNPITSTLLGISLARHISVSTGSDVPNDYLKPLDIVSVEMTDRIHSSSNVACTGLIRFYHKGIYLGNGWVCHFSKKNNGTTIEKWNDFIKEVDGEIIRHHPMIPFKHPRRIAEQIAWAKNVNFRSGNYDLANRNCEHFANMVVYGINYSGQAEDKKGRVSVAKTTKKNIFPTLSAFGSPQDDYEINNGKGSTIKLTNEMRESNGNLGESTSGWYNTITQIEVPPKQECKIM